MPGGIDLRKTDLTKKLSKKEYRSEIKKLEEELSSLQQRIKDLKIPVLIVFEGWSASGKGMVIARVVNPLDPRGVNVYTMDKMTEEKALRPVLWSYWCHTPTKGRIAIFDKSWHRITLPEGEKKWRLTATEKDRFFYDINAFEKQLTQDGTLIIKFFLHIGKNEQQHRFEELENNEATKWRINSGDWLQNKQYSKYMDYFTNMMNYSDEQCGWTVIEANDIKYATVKIYKTLIKKISAAVEKNELTEQQQNQEQPRPDESPVAESLQSISLDKHISDNEYKDKLKYYQNKLSNLCFKLYSKRVSVVIVYEGWDAAGKGGNIKRLTQELDPRGYEVVPIAAPTSEELNHHYLWRFWKKIPKDGHITIFDRSWYGRVMVERIENLATQEEWRRAYKEINDMELHMANHGIIIFKFWLQIDKDEQLLRFQSRQADPLKQYKITDEDWRNREKWDVYEQALNEMLLKTDTPHAPWTVIESNNKKYARIKTLELVSRILESKLK